MQSAVKTERNFVSNDKFIASNRFLDIKPAIDD